MSLCSTCNKKLFYGNGHVVVGVTCHSFFHATKDCTRLTASEIKVVELKTKSMLYKCEDCHTKGISCCSEALAGLKVDLDAIKKSCSRIDSLASDIKDLQASVNTIPELQSNMDDLKAKVDSMSMQNSEQEALIKEIQDRIQRAKNIILFHVDENPDVKTDTEVVKHILKDIPVSTDNITTTRIGNPVNGEIRPLLVTLNNTNDPHLILKNKSKLDLKYGVSLDKTKQQRLEYKAALDSLKLRMSKGETDLVVRYVNNKPIVTKKTVGMPGNPGKPRATSSTTSSTLQPHGTKQPKNGTQ
ncbi:hypothetical protein QAD02_014286 [Eretmocerus hayati]|uniref:Uncharacterized protein n=1 Tax=Eretmocerus hayati TaxID=131215 RepID=A0ACC2P7C6_9HYME|nr:hypothetical protein QAD02_014286 [Eretmocerus hayati]